MKNSQEDFTTILATRRDIVFSFLKKILLSKEQQEENKPTRLLEAIRYGTLDGGKCIRAFLVMESTIILGGTLETALPVAAALECIHSYSLIHDDLPQMDNDPLRHGKPTVHRAFDEATAILAGDALLTLSFEIIAHPKTTIPEKNKLDLILALAQSAGIYGMVGGQSLDLEAKNKNIQKKDITLIHSMKTGSLIKFACQAGALITNAEKEDRERFSTFGCLIGQAFQIADDLLDLTGSTEETGKKTKKDADAGKATLTSIQTIEETKIELHAIIEEAKKNLNHYGKKADKIKEMADFIITRTH